MSGEVDVHLSFWPSGIEGASGSVHTASVSPAELAELCTGKEYGCPMGCFACPFDRKCGEISEADWMALFRKEEPKASGDGE